MQAIHPQRRRRQPDAAKISAIRALDAEDETSLRDAFEEIPESRWQALLESHRRGSTTMLVAWAHPALPLGLVCIGWTGPRHPAARRAYPDCAEVESVHVRAASRSLGIGSRLFASGEGLALARGRSSMGLEISIDNVHAYALCLRLGYLEPQRIEYEVSSDAARRRFLVKPL